MAEKINIQNIDRIVADLGANYKNDDKEVLTDILEQITSIASDISNRKIDDTRLFPYIKTATKSEYQARGAEGSISKTEGSISSQYSDIVDKMRNDIIKNGLRRLI